MDDRPLASFKAKDGTGLWEVFPWGLRVDGDDYLFTGRSHIISSGFSGHTETQTDIVEEKDSDLGFWAALAVYQETGSLSDAGSAAWALGGSRARVEVATTEVPGNVTLSIGHLAIGRRTDLSLRYREDGRWVQVGAIRHFATVTKAAIKAHRERCQ